MWMLLCTAVTTHYASVVGLYFDANVVHISNILFLADRTNGRAIATLLRLSVVCDVMYCG